MEESEKENLFITFQHTIRSIINDKQKNPKNEKLLNKFSAKINLGLQIKTNDYFWLHLIGENGKFTLNKGRLEDFDLEIMSTPFDFLFFVNGENSTLHMMFKKNSFGVRKLRFSKSSEGKNNFRILLQLPKLLVLD